jgi:ribosome-associated protein
MATVRDLVRAAARAAEEKKAQDVRAIDVRGLSSVTDYMLITTGTSDTNVRAIAENVRDKLAAKGERPFSLDGLQEGTWALLDYVDFVVHVFHAEKRLYFGLEELWADAKALPIAPRARAAAAPGPSKVAARPAAAKEALPPVPRTALKPAAKKKAAAGTRAPAPKKAAIPKRTAQD